jgi:hypothetical protein
VSARAVEPEEHEPGAVLTGAGLGVLSLLPLFVAYEWALLSRPDAPRNAGELVLQLSLEPLGATATWARWLLIAAAMGVAVWRVQSQRARVADGIARILLEGLAFAVVLGPALVIGVRLLSDWAEPLEIAWDPVASRAADPVSAAILFGGSAWEELVFRMGAYSFLYWLALRALQALSAPELVARGAGELAGLIGSAAFFAAAHLEPLAGRLGAGGQPFDRSLFCWLLLAGVALGLLFRLRGPGVAAWAHGLFNAALWIGVDPQVLV